MESRGSCTDSISAEEICDLVFGEYTKDGPTPRPDSSMQTCITHPWEWFFDGERPDWYLPWPDPKLQWNR